MVKHTGKDIQPFPEKDERDFGYLVTRTTAGAMPFIGSGLQEVLDAAIGRPSEKRRVAWFKTIGEALQEVCKQVAGLTPEALGENEKFQDVVAKATDIALRNHHAEKLEALRNIVINTASGISIDDVLKNTFLDLVDRFSPQHIVVLRLNNNPASSPEMVAKAKVMMAGPFRELLRAAMPGCPENILDQVESDLVAAQLTGSNSKGMQTGGNSLLQSRTTERGNAFIQFISR